MAMSSTDLVADIKASVADFLVPEMDVMTVDQPEKEKEMMSEAMATKDKKKKKKEKKGVDIEDMYSFDPTDLKKAKPEKRMKQVTLKHLEDAIKRGKKYTEEEAQEKEEKEEKVEKGDDEDRESRALHRFPSPSRSRQSSPQKQSQPTSSVKEEEEKKVTLNAAASEFVPPSVSPAPKKSEESKVDTTLKATASEFVPPGFSSPAKTKKTLQASANEFVPPGFESKAASKDASKPVLDVIPPQSEPSTEACWAHAVFTPPAPVQASAAKPLPTETAKAPPVPPMLPLKLGEISNSTPKPDKQTEEQDPKWTARFVDAGSVQDILSKVTNSLFKSWSTSGAASEAADVPVDPSKGKVVQLVRKIEEKEADNEAEKQREEAMKTVHEKKSEKQKKAEKDMDDRLMDCFLQAVKTRVKDRDLPIMGTTLYGKHMRASRKVGTSCDVKDSSFVWLRPFLESLEEFNLIKLKPEVKDPTVTWINRNHQMIKEWQTIPFNETHGARYETGPRGRR